MLSPNISFPENSNNGTLACARIRVIDNLAFHKRRHFRLHFVVFELGIFALRIRVGWAWIFLINDDCKGPFMDNFTFLKLSIQWIL